MNNNEQHLGEIKMKIGKVEDEVNDIKVKVAQLDTRFVLTIEMIGESVKEIKDLSTELVKQNELIRRTIDTGFSERDRRMDKIEYDIERSNLMQEQEELQARNGFWQENAKFIFTAVGTILITYTLAKLGISVN